MRKHDSNHKRHQQDKTQGNVPKHTLFSQPKNDNWEKQPPSAKVKHVPFEGEHRSSFWMKSFLLPMRQHHAEADGVAPRFRRHGHAC